MVKYDFGKYLAYLRKKNGLSQEKLGEKLGISGKSISKWERGLTFPNIKIIYQISGIFHVTCDEILEKICP